MPSNVPTNQPTGTPTNLPSNVPTFVPSSNPTAAPTQIPTNPSSTPTVFPTIIPTNLPSGAPTSVPSSLPTQLFCKPGQRKTNFEDYDSLECIDCLPGSISVEVNAPECSPCPPGFIGTSPTNCEICPTNTYQSGNGATKCDDCPLGTTSRAGAVLASDCISVIVNYTTAFISLLLIVFISIFYIFRGRLMKVSHNRSKSLELVEDLGEVVTRKIETLRGRLAVEYSLEKKKKKKEMDATKKSKKGLTRLTRTIRAFVKFLTFILIFACSLVLMVAINYSVAFIRIFFSSLLFAKSLNVNLLFFGKRLKEIMKRVVELLALDIPGLNINVHIDISIDVLISILRFFVIDLDALDITCEGAKAPTMLMISGFILSFVWLSLSSNFQYYQSLFVLEYNRIFLSTAVQYNMGIGRTLQSCSVLAAGFISFASYAFSIQRILQITMSAVSLTPFIKVNGRHEYTDSCNFVEGLENIDMIVAYCTTLVFYALAIPVFYSLSAILVPLAEIPGQEDKKFNQRESIDDFSKMNDIMKGIYGVFDTSQQKGDQQQQGKENFVEELFDVGNTKEERVTSKLYDANEPQGCSGNEKNSDSGLKGDPQDNGALWEEHIDDESGEVYYRNNETGESTFDRPDCIRTVPYPWDEYYDNEGLRYYHNILTDETTYERPNFDIETTQDGGNGKREEDVSGIETKSSSDEVNENSKDEDHSMWEIHHDEENIKYFYHSETLESTYDCPDALRIVELPWDDYTDDEGEKYYYNHDTNYSTYDLSEVPKFVRQGRSKRRENNIDEVSIDISDENDDDNDDGSSHDGDIGDARDKNKGGTHEDHTALEIHKDTVTMSPLQNGRDQFESATPVSSKISSKDKKKVFRIKFFMSFLRGTRITTDEKGKFVEYEVRCEIRAEQENIDKDKELAASEMFTMNRSKVYNWSVWRRFNDFKKLNNDLRTVHREAMNDVVFPSSHTTTFNKLSSHFIEKRKKELSEYWLHVREVIPKMDTYSLNDVDTSFNEFLEIGAILSEDPALSLSRDDLNLQDEFEGKDILSIVKKIFSYLQPDLLLRKIYVDWLLFINGVLGLEVTKEEIGEMTEANKIKYKRVDWKQERSLLLPTYHELCRECSKDMTHHLTNRAPDEGIDSSLWWVCYTLCVALGPIAHCSTKYGRSLWSSVLSRFYIFLSISIGYWNEKSMNSYKLKGITKVESKKFDFSMNMAAYLAPRYVVLQLAAPLTALSIFAINTSSCPLFVYCDQLANTLPPLLYSTELAYEIAAERYMEDYGDDEQAAHKGKEWILFLDMLNILFGESRLMQFISLSAQSLIALLILSENELVNYYLIPLLLLIMLPFHLGSSSAALIAVGNVLDLHDKDLKYVYACYKFLNDAYNSRAFKYAIVILFFPIILPLWLLNYYRNRKSENETHQKDEVDISIEQNVELPSINPIRNTSIMSDQGLVDMRDSFMYSPEEIDYHKELERRHREIEEQAEMNKLNELSKKAEEALKDFGVDNREVETERSFWEEKFDSKKQRKYWKNHKTGEKTWKDPSTMKSIGEDVQSPFGLAPVTAISGGGRKVGDKSSVSFSLAEGTTVSSVLHETTTTIERGSIMMDWEEKFDKRKQKKYYKNKTTGMVQWKDPAAGVTQHPEKYPRKNGSSDERPTDNKAKKSSQKNKGPKEKSTTRSHTEQASNFGNKKMEADGNWIEKYDENKGKKYWKNAHTGKSQWGNPFEVKKHDTSTGVASSLSAIFETLEEGPTTGAIELSDAPIEKSSEYEASPIDISIDNQIVGDEDGKKDKDFGDWIKKFSKAKQKHYYQNEKTGEKSWKAPGGI